MGIRLAVVDDNPHVSWKGRVYPLNATFHRFLTAVLDVPGAPVASIAHCVPLRAADAPPATLPLDPRLEVVGTAPFEGIAGYVRRAPDLLRHNRRVLGPVIRSVDLLWLKVPASNAALAAALAAAAGVPRFTYVAGSALAVARARRLGPAALAVGVAYDVAGRLAAFRGERVVVGQRLDRDGIVTSLVEPDEVRDVGERPWPAIPWRLRIAWAGRLAPGKGFETLLATLRALASGEEPGHRVELVVLGDGPERGALDRRASDLGIADRIHWLGYVADRATYLDALAACDVFVHPSPAEGFPKVVLDAMAVGLPVVAVPSGALGWLGDTRLERPGSADPEAVAAAVAGLVARPARALELRANGLAFVRAHTRPAEAARLVGLLRARFPRLPWS